MTEPKNLPADRAATTPVTTQHRSAYQAPARQIQRPATTVESKFAMPAESCAASSCSVRTTARNGRRG